MIFKINSPVETQEIYTAITNTLYICHQHKAHQNYKTLKNVLKTHGIKTQEEEKLVLLQGKKFTDYHFTTVRQKRIILVK